MAVFTEREEYKFDIYTNKKNISIRTSHIIEKDGVEVSVTYSRKTFSPLDNFTNEPQEVQDVLTAIWTPKFISNYEQELSQLS